MVRGRFELFCSFVVRKGGCCPGKTVARELEEEGCGITEFAGAWLRMTLDTAMIPFAGSGIDLDKAIV